jgi:hypothetical protein
MSKLPHTEEWGTFTPTLELTAKADTVASIFTELQFFEARLVNA